MSLRWREARSKSAGARTLRPWKVTGLGGGQVAPELPYVASLFHSCARCALGTFVLSHERERRPNSDSDRRSFPTTP
jgi:hypothetical protein